MDGCVDEEEGQLAPCSALASDRWDYPVRKVEHLEFTLTCQGGLTCVCISFNISWIGHILKGAIKVERWPRAALLPSVEHSASGVPWIV
jgi:hypothetical protein